MSTSSPGTELATRTTAAAKLAPLMSNDEIERTWRIASALAKSGVFKDVTQAEQAFAKILLGRDLGLSPAQSMNAMDFVRGNVMLRSVTLAAFVKKSDGYDYHIDEHTEATCSITFFGLRPDGERVVEGVSTFTIENAKAAKLIKADSAWAMHPRNMLFARAMSNGVKWFCPDMLGGIPVYTEGDSFEPPEPTIIGSVVDEPSASPAVLPPAAERILIRAHKLGHDGLSDRATAEMTLAGQDESYVREWCQAADAELDEMERPKVAASGNTEERGSITPASDDRGDSLSLPDGPSPEPPPADVPPADREAAARALRDDANALLDQATEFRTTDESSEQADTLELQASGLMAEAEALSPSQDIPELF